MRPSIWDMKIRTSFIKYDNNILKLNGPRNNFDKNNNFIEPKNISSKRISYKKLYEKSLFNSVNHFMKTVKNKKKFQNELSLISNKLILQK